jgi:outer membrane protein OmpA-like peptidoglycan-associated protein
LNRILYTIALVVCLDLFAAAPLWASADGLDKKQLTITQSRVQRTGEKVNVSLRIEAGRRAAKDGRTLIVMPLLSDGFYKWSMPIVVVRGRKADRILRRHKWAGEIDPLIPAIDAGAIVLKRKGEFVDYRTTFDFQPWMAGSDFVIEAISVGRVGYQRFEDKPILANVMPNPVVEEVAPAAEEIVAAMPIVVPEPVPVPVTTAEKIAVVSSFILPYAALEQHTPDEIFEGHDDDNMQIFFRNGSHIIDHTIAGNDVSLKNVLASIRQIDTSGDSRVRAIMVAGFASIDGPAKYNEQLAMRRALALKKLIVARTHLPENMVTVYCGGEDWDGLRRAVEKSPDVPQKREVLHIIDTVPLWDKVTRTGREGELMKLDGGRTYKWMERHMFPKLRSASSIRVFYDNR